jgi:hypothetical protein
VPGQASRGRLGKALGPGRTPTASAEVAGRGVNPSYALRREELLQPDVMLPSVYWLCSDEANDVTGRRFLGIRWDAAKPADVASQEAGAPIGWKDLAVQPVRPPLNLVPAVVFFAAVQHYLVQSWTAGVGQPR